VVLLAAADMLHFANGFQPMAPESKAIPPRTPAIAFLQEHRDEGRIVGLGGTLPNDWSLIYGLHDIRGYDPPQPTLRYYRLWRTGEPDQLNWMAFWLRAFSPEAMQLASVLGARYVVTPPGVEPPSGGGPPVRALRLAYEGDDAWVYENPRAAPRALVPADVRVVGEEDEARLAVADVGFDPRREAVVEGVDAGAAAGTDGVVTVSEDSGARVVLDVELERRGLVVLNDNWSEGSSVRVDGKPREALAVNDVMRGVVVGEGAHEVEWRYAVPGLRAGVALSLAAVALAIVLGLWRILQARRERA
jgi:hypothetical protein